jgi:hypothetical protein
MRRNRNSKFSFPIPGRKPKGDHDDNKSKALTPIPSISSMPSVREHPLRFDEEPTSSLYSKAQRVLGNTGPPYRPNSRQTSVPPSPGHMSITISDGTSDYDGRTEDGNFLAPMRPSHSNRASSNILPSSVTYNESERAASVSSSVRPRRSNSTIRSHYDARNSPMAISQQTSDSAVRDMALRKGQRPVATEIEEEMEDSNTHIVKPVKNKPSRLDLSKLFPKPGQRYDKGLLSPNKMVVSPTAMSAISEHFPRPMTREPTPTLASNSHGKLTKSKPWQPSTAHPGRSMSPSRLYGRDTYDNAKVHVRKPPQGIKHWFDALDEESDDMEEEEEAHALISPHIKPSDQHQAPPRRSSRGVPEDNDAPKGQASRASQYMYDSRKGQYVLANTSMANRLSSPSQHSLQSHSSQTTSWTKDSASALSKKNLQNSSVLSFSSSEDEGDDAPYRMPKKISSVPVRDSIDIDGDHGDIVIGQAQAFPMRPSSTRRSSAGKLSILSASTNAATIEVMYTPEPYAPQHFPRHFTCSSRRSSHVRQPSIIPESENEASRPKTATSPPQSPTARSVRTSKSEPRSGKEAQKFMAVTPEEEALLEALRKKRAAMAQQSWVEGYTTAIKGEDDPRIHHSTPPELKQKHKQKQKEKKNPRTSAFLTLDSPSVSPVRVVETKTKPRRKSLAPIQTPLLAAPSRGRSVTTTSKDMPIGSSILRDSSSCDPQSIRHLSIDDMKLARRLSPQPESSPFDVCFPSPTTLPSPITPGLKHGESEVQVKVVSSEPSCNSDTDDVAVLDSGVIDAPAGFHKSEEPEVNHHRRRTASSGTDVPRPIPILAKAHPDGTREIVPASKPPSRTPSVVLEPILTQPKLPRKSSLRQSSLSISTTGLSNSRHSSITSLRTVPSMRTSSPVRTTAALPYNERRPSSRAVSRVGSMNSMNSIKRDSVAISTVSSRCSVSDDVMAAWGNLGGNYERPRW